MTRLKLTPILLLSVLLFQGCKSYVAVFKSDLTDVRTNDKTLSEQIVKCDNVTIPKNVSIKCGTFETEDLLINIEGTQSYFIFTLYNKQSEKVYINWDEAIIVYPDNTSDLVVNSSTNKFHNITYQRSTGWSMTSLQGSTILGNGATRTQTKTLKDTHGMPIPSQTTIKQYFTRIDVAGSSILPVHSKFKNKLLNYYSSFINNRIKILIPIVIGEEKFDYLFEFSIYDLEAI